MNRRLQLFWILVAIQASFLLAWAGYHEAVRRHSPVILLHGRPVDPQDLLRGDFMILGYDIGWVAKDSDLLRNLKSGDQVWVLLEPRGKYHEVASVTLDPPAPGRVQVLVRGRVAHDWRANGERLRLVYGIEQYFVPEGMGTPRFETMEIEVSVSPAHQLYLRRVLLDGKPYP